MTSVSFLYTQSDSANAETLKKLVQARLGTRTDVKTTRDMIAEVAEVAEGEVVKDGLTISDCVVLIGSRQASSMIQNNQQEIEDGSPLFDGSLISSMFTAKHGRLVIVFFSKKDENDWIPPEFDSNKIFHFCDGEIDPTTVNQLVDCIKGIFSRKN